MGAAPRGGGPDVRLVVIARGQESLRCRIVGASTFAAMLKLENEVARLSGVREVRVTPEDGMTPLLAITCGDPDKTLKELLNLPNFPMRMEES